jgi:hypothetical protein
MSATYDAYKAEAWRILATPNRVVELIKRHVESLKCPYQEIGATRCPTINENHYQTREKLVMTVAGHADLVYNVPLIVTSQKHVNHNRWLVRKLKEYGSDIDSACTRVSTCNGSVYFSYHLIIHQDSYLLEK